MGWWWVGDGPVAFLGGLLRCLRGRADCLWLPGYSKKVLRDKTRGDLDTLASASLWRSLECRRLNKKWFGSSTCAPRIVPHAVFLR